MLVYLGTAGYPIECVKGSIGLLQPSLSFEELFSYNWYRVRSHLLVQKLSECTLQLLVAIFHVLLLPPSIYSLFLCWLEAGRIMGWKRKDNRSYWGWLKVCLGFSKILQETRAFWPIQLSVYLKWAFPSQEHHIRGMAARTTRMCFPCLYPQSGLILLSMMSLDGDR